MVIVSHDPEAIRGVESLVDLFEVRIDIIGECWTEAVKSLKKPWIATNRSAEEGGKWSGTEARRIEQLLQAMELGASIVDIELSTRNLENIVKVIKKRTKCLLSFHDRQKTPPLVEMKEIIQKQLKAGADICKLITTARQIEDNLSTLQLIREFPEARVVSFAMGPLGAVSRVLCPLVGGDFTYASMAEGKESADGQIAVKDMLKIYEMVT